MPIRITNQTQCSIADCIETATDGVTQGTGEDAFSKCGCANALAGLTGPNTAGGAGTDPANIAKLFAVSASVIGLAAVARMAREEPLDNPLNVNEFRYYMEKTVSSFYSDKKIWNLDASAPSFDFLPRGEQRTAEEAYSRTIEIINEQTNIPQTAWFDVGGTIFNGDLEPQGFVVGMMKALAKSGSMIGLYTDMEAGHVVTIFERFPWLLDIVTRDPDGSFLVRDSVYLKGVRDELRGLSAERQLKVPVNVVKPIDPDQILIDDSKQLADFLEQFKGRADETDVYAMLYNLKLQSVFVGDAKGKFSHSVEARIRYALERTASSIRHDFFVGQVNKEKLLRQWPWPSRSMESLRIDSTMIGILRLMGSNWRNEKVFSLLFDQMYLEYISGRRKSHYEGGPGPQVDFFKLFKAAARDSEVSGSLRTMLGSREEVSVADLERMCADIAKKWPEVFGILYIRKKQQKRLVGDEWKLEWVEIPALRRFDGREVNERLYRWGDLALFLRDVAADKGLRRIVESMLPPEPVGRKEAGMQKGSHRPGRPERPAAAGHERGRDGADGKGRGRDREDSDGRDAKGRGRTRRGLK